MKVGHRAKGGQSPERFAGTRLRPGYKVFSAQRATGPQGAAGIGLVQGAYLYLPTGTAAPAGFTKVGTGTSQYKDLNGKNQNAGVDVYQKNESAGGFSGNFARPIP